ncbi:hypothetical protein WEI85_38750 [Actinomycetes bacterium KLBMP 9797]
MLLRAVLPAATPLIMAGVRLGVGRAVTGMINGEMFVAVAGLGRIVTQAGGRFDGASVLAVLLVVIAVARYFARMRALAVDPRALKRWLELPAPHDLDARLRMMDELGDGYQQILTLSSPPIELLAGPAESPALARLATETMRELRGRRLRGRLSLRSLDYFRRFYTDTALSGSASGILIPLPMIKASLKSLELLEGRLDHGERARTRAVAPSPAPRRACLTPVDRGLVVVIAGRPRACRGGLEIHSGR